MWKYFIKHSEQQKLWQTFDIFIDNNTNKTNTKQLGFQYKKKIEKIYYLGFKWKKQ